MTRVTSPENKGLRRRCVTASSEIDLTASEGLPEVVERLATYRDTTGAYQAIVARLTHCKQVKGEIDGESLAGSLKPVALGHYGVKSAAFSATFSGNGTKLADDVAIVRLGGVILGIDEGGYDPIGLAQFRSVVSAAAKKLS